MGNLPPPPQPRSPDHGPTSPEPSVGNKPSLSARNRRSLRRSVRADRARFWSLVLVTTALIIGVVVAGVLLGVDLWVIQGLVVGGFVAVVIWLGARRDALGRTPHTDSSTAPAAPREDAEPCGPLFTNIAFSERRPTWRGWSRDVGELYLFPDRITIEGLKGSLVVDAPFAAVIHQEKYSYWPLIKVTRPAGASPAVTAYLAVRGAPRSKFAAKPEQIAREAQHLCDAINASQRSAGEPSVSDSPHPPGWLEDPSGRHQFRYWDGVSWTDHVSDKGIVASDPPSG